MKSQLKLNTLILLLSGLFVLSHTLFAAAGDLDTTFNGTGKLRVGVGGGADYVNAMVRQSDNKLIVAGKSFGVRGDSFSLVRYNTNGTLDTTFGTGGKVLTLIGVANAVAILSDGKILAAGSNSSDFVIAKYNSNGTFDTTFGTGGIVTTDFGSVDQAYAMVVQSDGKIILAGGSSNYVAVARYNSNGTLDTSFSGDGKATQYVGSNSSPNAKAVVILNGRIYYAGNTDDRNNAGFVGCFNSDGSPNVAFGNGNGIIFIYISFNNNPVHVNSLAVLGVLAGEEKLIIAGEITGSESVQKLWSRDANNGSADNTFGNSGSVTLNAAGTTGSAVRILNSNGVASRIVVAGTITGAENNDFMIARYQLNGALDTAFDGDGIATADIYGDDGKAMLIQPTDDKIVVAGTTGKFDADFGIVRFNTNGSLDTTFSGDGKQFNDLSDAFAAAAAMIVQPDGKIVAAGETFLARFNTDGTFDTTFDGDGITRISTGYITGAAIQADGKIVLAAFYSSNTFAAYRFNADGSPDYAFDGDGIATATFTGLDANPRAVAIQSDGAIVLAGRINVGSSTSQNYDFAVARFLSNGALDNSFSGDGVATTAIFSGEDKANAVAIQSDGKIVVAGYAFNNNNNNFAIVRYTTTGALDGSFSGDGIQTTAIGTGNVVNALTIQPNGKIIAAGYASNDFAVARYNADGSLDTTFDNDGKLTTPIGTLNDVGNAVAVQTDGKILVAGSSQSDSNVNDFAVVRYNSNGSLDASYGSNGKKIVDVSGSNDFGNAAALDSSGRAIIVGEAKSLFGIVRLLGDAPVAQTYEGDVASRPNGDGMIASNDVVQMLRFLNEIDVPNTTSSEFQRADSAPRTSRGDGTINSSDVVQTIRYLNELDALQLPGGALSKSGEAAFEIGDSVNGSGVIGNPLSGQMNGAFKKSWSPSVAPKLRVENAAGGAGKQVTVNIRADAVGNEAQYGFAVLYDPDVLTYTDFAAGTTGAETFSCNTTMTAGRLRCSIGNFSGNHLETNPAIGEIEAGGNQLLIKLIFTSSTAAKTDATTALKLSGQSASDENADSIIPATTDGTVTVEAAAQFAVVSGRIITPDGRGLRNATVTMTDTFGNTRTTRTPAFGYFLFANVGVGQKYVLTVSSKNYQFEPQVLSVTEDIDGLNLTVRPDKQ